jgi:transcriptional regulator with XRE-family HTH domain
MTISLDDFKNTALENSNVAEEYSRLSCAYSLRKQLVKMRKDAGLTQEEISVILHTQKSNISRLENANCQVSPKLSTIEKYAKALGYKLEIKFVPQSQ